MRIHRYKFKNIKIVDNQVVTFKQVKIIQDIIKQINDNTKINMKSNNEKTKMIAIAKGKTQAGVLVS